MLRKFAGGAAAAALLATIAGAALAPASASAAPSHVQSAAALGDPLWSWRGDYTDLTKCQIAGAYLVSFGGKDAYECRINPNSGIGWSLYVTPPNTN
jgi:hypothetical protein